MVRTRSSARLANANAKEKLVKAIKNEEVDDPMLLDEASVKAESEYDLSEDEDTQSRPPPRKRQRTSIDPPKTQVRKKQVRGKQGGLAGLVNMPIDIFTEIASHLLPIDIISLSRANKSFRDLLTSRSSSHIWHSVMRNVRGLPPCPPDLTEPHYLALLFCKHCTTCGQPVRCRVDEILRVRLCVHCRDEQLISLDLVAWELRSLVHHSGKIVPSKRRWGPGTEHALKEEVQEVEQKHRELSESGDEPAKTEWEAEKRAAIAERSKQASAIQEFLDTIDNDREQELREVKRARRLDIESRLVKLGWDKKDMQFTYNFPTRREWYSLVEHPRPLTERIWSNLKPKLIPILESNRESRLQKERDERQSTRRNRLVHLMNEIKKDQAPILDITVRSPANSQVSPSNTGGSGDASQEAGPSSTAGGVADLSTHTVFRGIFPDIVDALEWPIVKELHETDSPLNEMEQNFAERRGEIDAAIVDWKLTTHTRLAEMLRQDQDIEGELLMPRLVVRNDDSDQFSSLSDDLKLILRADSFFTGPQMDTVLNSYDVILTRFGYGISFRDGMMSRPYRPPLNLSRIRVQKEARQIARMLLANMGLENASMVELKSVGKGYACARCHDSGLKTWQDLILHFLEAKEVVARVEANADQLQTMDITYRDIHDPEVFSDRPLVKYTTEQNGSAMRSCLICSKSPIAHNARGPEVKIIEHVKDVHDIAEPKFLTHYSHDYTLPPFEFDSPLAFDSDFDVGIFPDLDPLWVNDWF